MSDTNNHAPAATAPPAAPADPPPAVTSGEKTLAVLAIAFAVLIFGMAIDMLTGGKLSGVVTSRMGSADE